MTINPIFYQVYTYSYLSQSAVQTNETWEANSATKNLKKCMKHNIGISRGVGGLKKNPFRGGGMDSFWNYTI